MSLAVLNHGVIHPIEPLPSDWEDATQLVVEKSVPLSRNGAKSPTEAQTVPGSSTQDVTWTAQKNQKRCELVDKEIGGILTADEQAELEQLQTEMLAFRRKVAPLPLDDLRQLHRELLSRAGDQAHEKA